ncbi:PHP domain-containing protein [Dorea ammoniilytica]|uniref:PHP domain-containing protein n=1 Tax=Dorea ammoniilytica TaxID=2981788 RepID=A0ABT2S5J2_9FIRM|nr:PHP domain-containing protein [Dorea ammoniilytica]MCU6699856.1 PHP domain-containing protein [Dorea ammoniilytica]SCH55420.1 error-prone DNA polymerase [uncultured Eubacterium sp.]
MKIVDLHTHTTASDGSYTPTELVKYAKQKGLSAIAITDHDTVAGVEEASMEGEELGIRVIPGAELSTRVDDCDVHMTSLFINCKNKRLIKRLDDMAASRQERNYKMVDKLHEAGFQIDRRDLDALGEGKILARGHIAQILIARGYATELKEALRKYLSKGTPGYVQKEVLSPEECIQLVHDAGGLIFVAHLHQIDPQDPEHCKDVARRLIRMGADGLETQYCEFDDEWRQATEQIAQECGCLRSGGSDFHGAMKKGLDLACGYGDLQVPYTFLEAMDAELARRKNERHVIKTCKN